MVFRQRLGLSVPPVLLRLAVAATFIWAGAGKFLAPVELAPQDEATLQAIESGAPATAPMPTDEDDAAPEEAAGEPVALGDGAELMLVQDADDSDAAATTTDADAGPKRTGKDRVALVVYNLANPDENGRMLLPAFMGNGKWPIWIAFMVGMTELVGGILILLGLLTRFAAFMIAGVMIGAIWMTTIGPVLIFDQPGWPRFFQILPAIDFSTAETAATSFQSWQTWLFQLAMLMGALSLMCLGAGPLSIDRFAFGKPGVSRDHSHDGDDAGDGDDD